MAKRKLLSWMRTKLLSYVDEHVIPIAEKQAMEKAYAKVAPLVTKMVQAKYKPFEMNILEKYDVAQLDECVKMTLPDERVVEFSYLNDEGVLVPMGNCRSRMFLANVALMHAFDNYEKALVAFEDETKRRVDAYKTLIRMAVYVDEIIEVWPQAAELLPANEIMAPLTTEQFELIKRDLEQRKAA